MGVILNLLKELDIDNNTFCDMGKGIRDSDGLEFDCVCVSL